MKQEPKRIILTFTNYDGLTGEERAFNDELCFEAPGGQWITSEDLLDYYLAPAFRKVYEQLIQPGDTLRITLEVKTPRTRKRRSSSEEI
jgi:hypothetical protein